MNNAKSFIFVDDLVGLNKTIDPTKLAKIVNKYRQTKAYCKKGREYSFSQTFNLKDWETIAKKTESEC